MLIPGDSFQVPTRNGMQWRTCTGKAWQANGIWHVPHDKGEYVGTYLPAATGYARYCWTRNTRHYEKSRIMHMHVQRHANDDDIFATESLSEAMSYAAFELNSTAEFEHEGISANGEQGDFESAYECFKNSECYSNLAMNANNIHKQLTCEFSERAPLYRGESETDNLAKLTRATEYVISEINSNGPDGFRIYKCAGTECEPTDED